MQQLYAKTNAAEKILVGLGEEFQYDWSALLEDSRYQEIEEEIGGCEEHVWIIPFLQKMILSRSTQNKWRIAYDNLREMLEGKDYFIVSLCMDDYIYATGFDESRIVTPCGGFRRMQCDQNCRRELSDIPDESYAAVMKYYRKELPIQALQEPVCRHCGSKLRYNQLGVTKYAEEGYLESWGEYTRWLQGTVNRNLCVLELGVGMEYPMVVRFPFEKIVLYNQKAFLYRVHSRLYQMGEEIGDRGIGIQANAIDFMS
ncbi:MAG: hypothetical protein K2P66_10605 [Lachnospiraceae bacterium]|nr:hypothetical protein [Lachnospiraceae bacterium]